MATLTVYKTGNRGNIGAAYAAARVARKPQPPAPATAGFCEACGKGEFEGFVYGVYVSRRLTLTAAAGYRCNRCA